MEGFSTRGKETYALSFIDGSEHTAMTMFNVECITEWNKNDESIHFMVSRLSTVSKQSLKKSQFYYENAEV